MWFHYKVTSLIASNSGSPDACLHAYLGCGLQKELLKLCLQVLEGGNPHLRYVPSHVAHSPVNDIYIREYTICICIYDNK